MCVKKCAFRPWICIVCAFVAFHVFTTVRCYKRDGTMKRGTMNCVRFRSTCPNNWRISRCMWNTLILELWNFVQLKWWEMCFKVKFASHWRHLCCCTLPLPRQNGSKGTLLCFPPVPLLLFHFEGEGTATCRLIFVEDDSFISTMNLFSIISSSLLK